MRDGFHEIVSGWTLQSGLDDLTDRIERAAKWTKANGPLHPDEEATIKLMIEAQIARGDGDEAYIPEGHYFKDDLDGGRLVKKGQVFTHCNVCGIKLRTADEDQIGMCERCAGE